MKARKEHRVPLTYPALCATLAGQGIRTGGLLFPAAKGGPLSENTLAKLLADMGVNAVPHGFRSTFKDWARECMPQVPDEVSELCLAHVNDDKTRAAYARTDMLEQRRALLESWANYLGGAQ